MRLVIFHVTSCIQTMLPGSQKRVSASVNKRELSKRGSGKSFRNGKSHRLSNSNAFFFPQTCKSSPTQASPPVNFHPVAAALKTLDKRSSYKTRAHFRQARSLAFKPSVGSSEQQESATPPLTTTARLPRLGSISGATDIRIHIRIHGAGGGGGNPPISLR